MDEVRDELIQVAAVAVAILTDMEQGSTKMFSRDNYAHHEVMEAVYQERIQQEIKWGPQHHDIYKWLAILGEEVGEACEAALEEDI